MIIKRLLLFNWCDNIQTYLLENADSRDNIIEQKITGFPANAIKFHLINFIVWKLAIVNLIVKLIANWQRLFLLQLAVTVFRYSSDKKKNLNHRPMLQSVVGYTSVTSM
jgi:hypothetical protein